MRIEPFWWSSWKLQSICIYINILFIFCFYIKSFIITIHFQCYSLISWINYCHTVIYRSSQFRGLFYRKQYVLGNKKYTNDSKRVFGFHLNGSMLLLNVSDEQVQMNFKEEVNVFFETLFSKWTQSTHGYINKSEYHFEPITKL